RRRIDTQRIGHRPAGMRYALLLYACIPKSVLLAAAARHRGIPARLGHHLTSEKLSASMGTDVFAWHGYAELLLNGQWRKLSTAFNIELCEKFGSRCSSSIPITTA